MKKRNLLKGEAFMLKAGHPSLKLQKITRNLIEVKADKA